MHIKTSRPYSIKSHSKTGQVLGGMGVWKMSAALLALSLTISPSLFALAITSDCEAIVPSTAEPYTCKVDVASVAGGDDYDFTALYGIDPETPTYLSVMLQSNAPGMIAWAVSPDGLMEGSNGVIFTPSDLDAMNPIPIMEYDVPDHAPPTESDAQMLVGESFEVDAATGITSVKFMRLLEPGGGALPITTGENIFLWAVGTNGAIQYHGDDRGFFTTNLASVFDARQEGPEAEEADEAVDAVPDVEENATGAGDATTCESSNPLYAQEVEFSSTYKWFYNLNEAANELEVLVEVASAESRWVGWGISPSGGMVGTHAVIGIPGGSVMEYELSARSFAGVQLTADQELTNAAISFANGIISMSFTIPLVSTAASRVVPAIDTTSQGFNYGIGRNDALGFHSNGFGGEVINLEIGQCEGMAGGSGSGLSPFEKKRFAHGWLMAFGWGLLMPVGAILARFGKKNSWWFDAHRGIQVLAAACAVAGFVLAVDFVDEQGASHFDSRHKRNGLIMTILLVIHVAAAALRPHVTEGESEKSSVRKGWEMAHKGLALALLVWAAVQIYSGLEFEILDLSDGYRIVYIVLVCVLVAAFLLLQGLAFREKGAATVTSPKAGNEVGQVPSA